MHRSLQLNSAKTRGGIVERLDHCLKWFYVVPALPPCSRSSEYELSKIRCFSCSMPVRVKRLGGLSPRHPVPKSLLMEESADHGVSGTGCDARKAANRYATAGRRNRAKGAHCRYFMVRFAFGDGLCFQQTRSIRPHLWSVSRIASCISSLDSGRDIQCESGKSSRWRLVVGMFGQEG
jgi:hypothetical protein